MAQINWPGVTKRERQIIVEALVRLKDVRRSHAIRSMEIDALISKMLDGRHPKISVGVYGGQVQWVTGNPFPIRIIDYDGEEEDLPDSDDEGNNCRLWFEPIDQSAIPPKPQVHRSRSARR